MKKKKKTLNQPESILFVHKVAGKIGNVMKKEIMKIDEAQRFLLMSRIINCVFYSHYQMTYFWAEEKASETIEK